jgi:hypothetical protein
MRHAADDGGDRRREDVVGRDVDIDQPIRANNTPHWHSTYLFISLSNSTAECKCAAGATLLTSRVAAGAGYTGKAGHGQRNPGADQPFGCATPRLRCSSAQASSAPWAFQLRWPCMLLPQYPCTGRLQAREADGLLMPVWPRHCTTASTSATAARREIRIR